MIFQLCWGENPIARHVMVGGMAERADQWSSLVSTTPISVSQQAQCSLLAARMIDRTQ